MGETIAQKYSRLRKEREQGSSSSGASGTGGSSGSSSSTVVPKGGTYVGESISQKQARLTKERGGFTPATPKTQEAIKKEFEERRVIKAETVKETAAQKALALTAAERLLPSSSKFAALRAQRLAEQKKLITTPTKSSTEIGNLIVSGTVTPFKPRRVVTSQPIKEQLDDQTAYDIRRQLIEKPIQQTTIQFPKQKTKLEEIELPKRPTATIESGSPFFRRQLITERDIVYSEIIQEPTFLGKVAKGIEGALIIGEAESEQKPLVSAGLLFTGAALSVPKNLIEVTKEKGILGLSETLITAPIQFIKEPAAGLTAPTPLGKTAQFTGQLAGAELFIGKPTKLLGKVVKARRTAVFEKRVSLKKNQIGDFWKSQEEFIPTKKTLVFDKKGNFIEYEAQAKTRGLPVIDPKTGAVLKGRQLQLIPKDYDVLTQYIEPTLSTEKIGSGGLIKIIKSRKGGYDAFTFSKQQKLAGEPFVLFTDKGVKVIKKGLVDKTNIPKLPEVTILDTSRQATLFESPGLDAFVTKTRKTSGLLEYNPVKKPLIKFPKLGKKAQIQPITEVISGFFDDVKSKIRFKPTDFSRPIGISRTPPSRINLGEFSFLIVPSTARDKSRIISKPRSKVIPTDIFKSISKQADKTTPIIDISIKSSVIPKVTPIISTALASDLATDQALVQDTLQEQQLIQEQSLIQEEPIGRDIRRPKIPRIPKKPKLQPQRTTFFDSGLPKKRSTRKALSKVPAYDYYIRRKAGLGFDKGNRKPLTKAQAINTMMRNIDTYVNRSGFIRQSNKTIKPSKVKINKNLLGKFRRSKTNPNVFVEKSRFAIDSWQEKQGIPFKAARLKRARPKKTRRKKKR